MSTMSDADIVGLHVSKQAAVFLAQAKDIDRALIAPRSHSTDWRHASLADFFFTEGKPFANSPLTVDEITSVKPIGRILRHIRPKHCFQNAHIISHFLPRLRYAEGVGISDEGDAILHAWIDLNGKAIDVTWLMDQTDGPCRHVDQMFRRIGHNLARCSYFGVVIPNTEVLRHVKGSNSHGSVVDCPACNRRLLREGIGSWLGGGYFNPTHDLEGVIPCNL